MSATVQIFLANARLDDAAAMTTLLSPVKDAETIGRSLTAKTANYVFVHDQATDTARFIVSDGLLVSCFSVVGVSGDEAKAISYACEEKTNWSLSSFQATVTRTLGGSFERVN